MVEESSNAIAQRTVGKILHGLEGAVITSIKEVNEHVMPAAAAASAPAAPSAAKKEVAFVAESQQGITVCSSVFVFKSTGD